MSRRPDDFAVPFVQPHRPPPRAVPAPPSAPWLFASWMAAGTTIAVLAGTLLGLLAAIEAGPGLSRWSQTVQAHGALQLTGWVAVFVTALAMEFVIRLNGRPPLPLPVRAAVPALLAVGALLRGAGQFWHEDVWWLFTAGSVLIVAGAAGFFAAILSIRPQQPLRYNIQPAWFWASATWLLLASVLALVAGLRATAGVLPLADSYVVTELMLRGFVFHAIVSVAMRAFPGHLGTPPVDDRRQALLLGMAGLSIVALVAGAPAFGLPGIELLARAGDLLFAATIGTLIVFTGILHPRNVGREPVYRLLIPVAFLGAAAYAVAVAILALLPGDATLYQTGAARHIFMLGFMAPLMVGMSHIVLARFLRGRVDGANWLTVAFGMLLVAWPLRVLPALFTDSPAAGSDPLFSTAAGLVIGGLLLVAVVAGANALATMQALRRPVLGHPGAALERHH
ncbi:MAG TPA: hypothetical protein VIH05_07945 [Tepidiformaceae bacterium]